MPNDIGMSPILIHIIMRQKIYNPLKCLVILLFVEILTTCAISPQQEYPEGVEFLSDVKIKSALCYSYIDEGKESARNQVTAMALTKASESYKLRIKSKLEMSAMCTKQKNKESCETKIEHIMQLTSDNLVEKVETKYQDISHKKICVTAIVHLIDRDSDKDGIPDDLDWCLNTPTGTAVDKNGCPQMVVQSTPPVRDSDNDGVPNDLDMCLNTPTNIAVDNNGCPQMVVQSNFLVRDTDNDGIPDDLDWCLGTPAGVNVNERGCPQEIERDSENDSVPNDKDRCPKTPANFRPVEKNGHKTVFRDKLKDGCLGPVMVRIPARKFRMGSSSGNKDEQPVHNVKIKKFAIGQYEITREEYRHFVEATGYAGDGCFLNPAPPEKDDRHFEHPVGCIEWLDAVAYTEWLTKQTGKYYRLPTEAEWEYAARAGTKTRYWWGNQMDYNHANCTVTKKSDFDEPERFKDDFEFTAPVGSFKPNDFGLYDTVGNVWEWTCSIYEKRYQGNEKRCAHKDKKGNRTPRGGAFNALPSSCRTANRTDIRLDNQSNEGYGMRVVCCAE